MDRTQLISFLVESLKIEGIHRYPTETEVRETENFLAIPKLSVPAVSYLVSVYEPRAVLRQNVGMDVIVGSHAPPRGGPLIRPALHEILFAANDGTLDAFEAHCRYETLHPFTDGNGRSGRAIWLWQMRDAPLGFLHHFYYQTLQAQR